MRLDWSFLALALTLTGCAGPEKPWIKDGAIRTAVEQALAECQYQAEAATIGIGAGSHLKTMANAVSSGIAAGVVRAMDEKELVEHCMKARGFSR